MRLLLWSLRQLSLTSKTTIPTRAPPPTTSTSRMRVRPNHMLSLSINLLTSIPDISLIRGISQNHGIQN